MNAHDPQLSPPPPKHATEADRLIGLRLTALRKARGLSQAALGAAVGITFQQIQKYERGRNRIGAGRLQTFARIFEVPVATFFEDQGDELSGEPAEVFGFLREPGAIDLLRIYAAIPDEGLRREIVALVRSTARLNRAPSPEAEVGA
ncbi:helix-turn-helix domain-containing protein [Methylorubrum sp. POS3]|uniref:helix-turn-helix domain-containing protein n=1 Tax=Methylorubrum sp. POS3 TaxID=2998492 RepID=UPI003726DE95